MSFVLQPQAGNFESVADALEKQGKDQAKLITFLSVD